MSDNETYSRHLSEDHILALESTLGKRILSIYSPSLSIDLGDTRKFTGGSFSISLPDDKVFVSVFELEWADTPACAIDYFQLEVTCQAYPRGLQDQFFDKMIHEPFGKIEFRHPWPVVRSIEIHEKFESDSLVDGSVTESVCYDQALVFNCDDSYSFCLWIDESSGIEGCIAFTDNPEFIAELLENRSPRKTLGAHLGMKF